MSSNNKYTVKTIGHEVLKQTAAKIDVIDLNIIQLASDMITEMNRFDGIGLAAPQIGVSKRIVVLGVPDYSDSGIGTPGEAMLLPQMPVALVNPEIISYGGDFLSYDEGCLSVPDIFGAVIRPEKIVLRATLLDGNTIECECGGLLARAIQHEIDHLDGLLFVDRMEEETRRGLEFKLFRLEKSGKKNNFERKCKK